MFAVLTSGCCRYMQMYTLATGKFMKTNGTLGIFDDQLLNDGHFWRITAKA